MTTFRVFEPGNAICMCLLLLCVTQISTSKRFEINYLNNTFMKDGIPFRYISGSFQYFRVHPDYWEDRLIKMRASGLNAAQVYIPWNLHEPTPGKFNWNGMANLRRVLQLMQKHDLAALLRLGPYICAVWEFGGLPAWLLNKNPSMVVRTSDPSYMKWVDLWFTELLNYIKPYLYENGGPVVMVQIENEYGSYFACDKVYLDILRDKVISILGKNVVIYSTDGGATYYLKCGKIEGVYATIDFGPTNNPEKAFQSQRMYEPKGPLVNSEFYTGWFDQWGFPHSTYDVTKVTKSLDLILNYSANVNMYMFVGGTNFEFWSGANSPPYRPVPTSYDQDAPLSEAGDITPKFYAIRDVVSKYLPLPSIKIPPNTNKTNYGPLPMAFVSTLQDSLPFLTPQGPVKSKYPVPMEQIGFYYGFILYQHVFKRDYESATLVASGIRDRAYVMVDAVPLGILERQEKTTLKISVKSSQTLDILVENQGRIGYATAMNFNMKGIITNVTLGGQILTDWLLYPLHMNNLSRSLSAMRKQRNKLPVRKPFQSPDGKLLTPSFYMGTFGNSSQELNDMYLDPRPWRKGQAFINDFNVGRYWPIRGPQVRLYVPKPVFSSPPAMNHVYLFEVEHSYCFDHATDTECQVSFSDQPYIDGPNHPDNL